MNAAQVRAKARMAMKKREEQIEDEELEGGEINLIPYLDIVTNLMLFLLASISAGFILGQINTTLPNYTPAAAMVNQKPAKKPDEQPLQLVVSVTKGEIIVWSVSGLEGTLNEPRARIPGLPSGDGAPPKYKFEELNSALVEIASRRWAGKPRKKETYEVILQVDAEIPYETVIAVMDNVRRKLTGERHRARPLAMPAEGEAFNPDVHPLFPDVLFAAWGFE
jgi:biopolymer transport protein ExbD